MGDGAEPSPIAMTLYEQDTLELGCGHSGRHPAQYDYYVRIGETRDESDAVHRLHDLDLIHLRSMSSTKSGAIVYLIRLTAKGDAVMRANWDFRKSTEST